jgi:hypothetical protein
VLDSSPAPSVLRTIDAVTLFTYFFYENASKGMSDEYDSTAKRAVSFQGKHQILGVRKDAILVGRKKGVLRDHSVITPSQDS